MKAIVLSSDDGGSVILGSDGIVYEVAAVYEVGDTVHYTPRRSYHILRRAAALAASLVILVSGIFGYSYQNLMVYATVHVDQLPGVEYRLNRRNRVVDIVGTTEMAKHTARILREGGAVQVTLTKSLERSSKLTHVRELSVVVKCDDSKGLKIVEDETRMVAAVVSVNHQDTGNAVPQPALEQPKNGEQETASENASGKTENGKTDSGASAVYGGSGNKQSVAADAAQASSGTSGSTAAVGGAGTEYANASAAARYPSSGYGTGTAGRKSISQKPEKVPLSDVISPDAQVTLMDEKTDGEEASSAREQRSASENGAKISEQNGEKESTENTENTFFEK